MWQTTLSKVRKFKSNLKCTTAATTRTTQPRKTIKIPSSDIASRELVKSMQNAKSQTG